MFFLSLGFYVIYLNKENAGKSHLTSWHGLLGAITVGYACLQSTGGSLAKYYNYTKRFLNVSYSLEWMTGYVEFCQP